MCPLQKYLPSIPTPLPGGDAEVPYTNVPVFLGGPAPTRERGSSWRVWFPHPLKQDNPLSPGVGPIPTVHSALCSPAPHRDFLPFQLLSHAPWGHLLGRRLAFTAWSQLCFWGSAAKTLHLLSRLSLRFNNSPRSPSPSAPYHHHPTFYLSEFDDSRYLLWC